MNYGSRRCVVSKLRQNKYVKVTAYSTQERSDAIAAAMVNVNRKYVQTTRSFGGGGTTTAIEAFRGRE
jgi:hypothetical protein